MYSLTFEFVVSHFQVLKLLNLRGMSPSKSPCYGIGVNVICLQLKEAQIDAGGYDSTSRENGYLKIIHSDHHQNDGHKRQSLNTFKEF